MYLDSFHHSWTFDACLRRWCRHSITCFHQSMTKRRTRVRQAAQRLELIRTWTQGGRLNFQGVVFSALDRGNNQHWRGTYCCDFLHAERNTACHESELWSKRVSFRKPRTSPAWLPTNLGSNAWHEQHTVLGRRCAARGVGSSAGIEVRSERLPVQASSVGSRCSQYGSTDADCNADLRATVTSCY